MTVRLGKGEDVYEALKLRSMGEGAGVTLNVQETDGDPSVNGVNTIIVTNGTLTDEGGGAVSITTGGSVSSTPPGYFGDGSDGDVTISADADVFGQYNCNNLTIDAGKILTIYAAVVFVKDTLTINGTIKSGGGGDGLAGDANSGSTRGAGGGAGDKPSVNITDVHIISPPGANGGNATQNGVDGLEPEEPDAPSRQITNNTMYDGAAGGSGAVGTGGAAGPASTFTRVNVASSYATACCIPIQYVGFVANGLNGGAGGGGGGAVKGGGGGGGGGGNGGNVIIVARNIVWGAAGLIEAIGGDGGNGGNSDGDGGGGGGGAGGNGGLVILCYETETGTRSVDVSKGTGGTGGTSVSASAGANGPNGCDGVVIDLNNTVSKYADTGRAIAALTVHGVSVHVVP